MKQFFSPSAFGKSVHKIAKNEVNKNNFFSIIKKADNNPQALKSKIRLISNNLGTLIKQNLKGEKIVEVKPDVKSLKRSTVKANKKKLRYHQTTFGGSIHTDGPQLKKPPTYVIMACVNTSKRGGESVLVDSQKLFTFLKKKYPKILTTLKSNFYFERRGFYNSNSGKKVLKKPIFEKIGKTYCFRYLRDYIESGFEKVNRKISRNQNKALNLLDSLLTNKKFQTIFKLSKGDILILNNNFIAHGRKGFSLNKKEQRTLLRSWIAR